MTCARLNQQSRPDPRGVHASAAISPTPGQPAASTRVAVPGVTTRIGHPEFWPPASAPGDALGTRIDPHDPEGELCAFDATVERGGAV